MTENRERTDKASAVITGCTSGLGRSLTDRFLSEGWFVTGCGRRADLLASLARGREDSISTVVCDIRLENHVKALRDAIASGPGHIDALVLNAGAIGQLPLPQFLQTNLMELRKLFETNVFANVNIVQQLRPLLRSGGIIVHITSDAARTPYPGWSGYGASKAAFSLAVETLNVELESSGLKAVNIDPGDMDTAMHRLAIPDADPGSLRRSEDAAAEVYGTIIRNLGRK